MHKALIQWYGAHPENRSVSMDIYRSALLAALPFVEGGSGLKVSCWPKEEFTIRDKPRRLRKALANYLTYPTRVFCCSAKPSLVHFLDHSSAHLLTKVKGRAKIVVTLHDLIPLRYPGELSKSQVDRFRLRVSELRRADAIIAVSEYSKNEAIDLLGCQPERIHVVPNGVRTLSEPIREFEVLREMRRRGCKMIVLSVGSLLERKNLRLLPDALKHAKEELGGEIALVRVGALLPTALRAEIEAVVGEERVHEFGRADQMTLDNLYHQVDLVFIPSLYEGFGLPVLEAFAAGKAVACSNRSSLPEVGLAEAFYFDPEDGLSAGRAIARGAPCNSESGAEGRRLAIAQAHSWENNLSSLFEIYAKLLE